MDKRMTGKWYKEELGETINIFDETPLRMKISFTSSGYYNFEPNCVYEKDGYLCRDYMIKNMLRCARCTLSKGGVDGRSRGSEYITLIPKEYPTDQFPEEQKAGFVYNDLAFWCM